MKKTTRISVLIALAATLGMVESLIPIYNGMIPGVKLGLANIAILIALYEYGVKESMFVSLLRVFLVGMIRTGLFNSIFLFSIVGAFFAVLMMGLFKSKTKMSMIGISIIGSVFHSIGQILIAILTISNINIIYYLPWLLLFAVPSGIIIGMVTINLHNRLKNSLIL